MAHHEPVTWTRAPATAIMDRSTLVAKCLLIEFLRLMAKNRLIQLSPLIWKASQAHSEK